MSVSALRIRSVPVLRRVARWIKSLLPPLNFITLHYIYFISVCLITSVIFWGAATPFRSVSYTDSLFFTVSAMTLAGLNTVNLSTLNTFQQFLLFVLIMLGSAILVSAVVVHIRRKAFDVKIENTVSEERRRKGSRGLSLSSGRLSSTLSASRQGTIAKEETRQVVPQGPGPFHRVSLSLPRSRPSTAGQEQKGGPDVPKTQPREDEARPALLTNDSLSRSHGSNGDDQGHVMFSPDTKQASPPRDVSTDPDVIGRGRSQEQASTNEKGRPSEKHRSEMFGSFRIGRNSTFHDVSEAQLEKLGGVEYRAITFLSILVPVYFVLWQLLGCLGVGAYLARNKASFTKANGINPWYGPPEAVGITFDILLTAFALRWTGAFFAVSAFNNSGMSILDANMTPFQFSYYMLITMGLLILAGNTCYPIFLRLIIWVLQALIPGGENYREYRETLQFLLDHPRRCYTNLFPSEQTWWLLLSVVGLNGIDWLAFEVLNVNFRRSNVRGMNVVDKCPQIGNPALKDLPAGTRAIDGLFQAFAVRSGGFYIIAIPSLRIALQVLYVVMMYISVYPVVITMRNSNVYEERSLGIYAGDVGEESQPSFLGGLKRRLTVLPPSPKRYFVQQQLRAQLAHDLWWIVLAVILVTLVETSQFERDPVTYSVFNVIFETISAYGCVGISTGLPDQLYSFSGGWHKLSKLILCAVMIRGRHRGLPVAIDRAVLLPGEHLAEAEEEDAQIRLERSITSRNWSEIA
ncbi:MAG: hypothetical protein M1839_008226 [Geoglossum umbratile]|nr:MAG: hypothetical protein M1839_008226 [Geoglossum umbratile]